MYFQFSNIYYKPDEIKYFIDPRYLTHLQENLDPDIMKLGLLSESGQNVATIREPLTFVSFGHKLLQEWAGAYYIARCLERTTDIKVNIC